MYCLRIFLIYFLNSRSILILSGIINDKKNLILEACKKEKLEIAEIIEDKEWVAMTVKNY